MTAIRFANLDDIEVIMNFIHIHWKKNHILSQNKDFFIYEYKVQERINFVIAEEGSELIGILGFLKASETKSDVWTTMWKVLPKAENPMLGLELLNFLRKSEEYDIVSSIGINKKTVGLYKFMEMYTDKLSHFVILNEKIKEFKIALISERSMIKKNTHTISNYTLKLIVEKDLDQLEFHRSGKVPFKDKSYIIKRFFEHPIYIYQSFGIFSGDDLEAVFITRRITCNNSSVLRIVDMYGDESKLKFVSSQIQELLIKNNDEYIDFMSFGFNEMDLIDAAFVKVNQKNEEFIIPNYFSPYVQKNIVINFFADTIDGVNLKFCKGDGDQDRPS
jgi:hypothetical protein